MQPHFYTSKSKRGFFLQVVWPNFSNSVNEVYCSLNFLMGLCQKCHVECHVLLGSVDERLWPLHLLKSVTG